MTLLKEIEICLELKDTVAHLHPLTTGLHGEDQTGIRFGHIITVRNSFTAKLEFHFG